jgi:DNA-binding CsgD family transcriptional regulator
MKNTNNHLLIPIWKKFPEIFAPESTELAPIDILNLISELFVVGDYYYFVIDFQNYTLHSHSPHLCAIHGLENIPAHLQQILDLTHPDDIEFVLLAEENCYAKVVEIGPQYTKSLKSSYCFRMRVADGSYHLFHHQAIVFDVDSQHQILRSLNIHTDIQHLTANNNHIATLMGINDRTDFHQIDLSAKPTKHGQKSPLTRRELEILPLIAKGLSSIAIAQRLGISEQTVRVHRKNILKKTRTTNSSSMIKKCIEEGLL